jgi:AraC-like DNA-binding protein
LAEIVEEIMDWDVPDERLARAMTFKTLPNSTAYLTVNYRKPLYLNRDIGSVCYRNEKLGNAVFIIGDGMTTARTSGPLGLIVIRLKPEAAAILGGCRMHDFINEKINLGDAFNASDVSLLEEMMMEAPDSATRFACVESFLLRNLSQCRPDAVLYRAAQCLRRNPSLRVRALAAHLDIGQRHLSRIFRAKYGFSPKRFARVARIEKILDMKHAGSDWADIAHVCGFADQAHMIHDFDGIVGQAPQQLFQATAGNIAWQVKVRIG